MYTYTPVPPVFHPLKATSTPSRGGAERAAELCVSLYTYNIYIYIYI